MLTLVSGVVLAVLVGLDWWRGSRVVRLAAVAVALVVLYVAQPIPYRALRRSVVAPPAERVTRLPMLGGEVEHLSEYQSGVRTMHRNVLRDNEIGAWARSLALGALVILALMPAWRGRWPVRQASARMERDGPYATSSPAA